MKSGKRIPDIFLSLGILALAFGISMLLQHFAPSQSLVALVFVLAVFLISVGTQGYLWGIAASIVSVLIDNFIFAFPYFAFDFLTPENFLAAFVMLAVSVITSTLTTKIVQQERIKAETENEKMRGNLLRAISHDLRTPLTTIYGSSSAIMENYDSLPKEQQLKLLSDIREDSENLIRMVENLLSVTRVNGPALQVQKTDTVLEELIDSVLLKFHKSYPNQPVQTQIPEEFISIPMDALLIQQVLINLLENAVIHAKGIQQLSLRVFTAGNAATFEVLDDGCGIPKEHMGDLFTGQLYGRKMPSDGCRTGMGIGLSVCSAIITAHGGKITAQNSPKGGACFRFTLELEESCHEQ